VPQCKPIKNIIAIITGGIGTGITIITTGK
jgi:hypothetical protein